MAAIKALQQWCKIQCEGYRDVAITNMTTSFRDGLAFCALIHKHRPDLINYDSLLKENVYENNNLAFRTAEDKLGIPALLEAEDMVALRVPDRLSVLTYVSQYYNYFHGRSPIGGMAGVKRPAEDNKEEPSGKKCQPVIAKPFPSKSSKENRPAPTITVSSPSRPSPKTARSAVQITTENSRTLSSSCAVCKKHVHLVQRHLVDGNLYHRNCFKCYECSKILLSGTFTNGPKPGTFICTFHPKPQYDSKTPSTKGPITATEGPSWMLTRKENSPVSYPSSVNTKSNSTMSTTKALSPLTEKTQSARQKFFQSPTSKLDSLPSDSWPAASSEISGKSRVVPNVDGEKAKAKLLITPKLTEGNSNNNTVYPSNFKLTDKRSGNASADIPTWKKDQHNPGKVLLKVAKPSSNLNCSPANLKPLSTSPVTNKDSHRPQSTPYNKAASHSESPADWRSMLKPVKGQKTAAGKCSSVSTETKTMEPLSKLSPSSPANIPSPLRAPVPIITPPVSLDDQSTSPLEPSHNGSRSWEFKNGKGSSPTNASKPEHELPKRKPDYIPKDEILKELQEIEDNLNDLEKKGVEMEKRLRRSEDDGEEDVLMDELMVDWFNLIRNKQVYMRRESELVYIAKTQDLEEQQPGVEEELRRLLEKPERLKTARDRTREAELMEKLVEIVNDRNAILEGLDEDRLREDEEDEQLNQMMHNLDLKKDKNKRSNKSPISKLFWWKNKDAVED